MLTEAQLHHYLENGIVTVPTPLTRAQIEAAS
jgi:hypothetical protein